MGNIEQATPSDDQSGSDELQASGTTIQRTTRIMEGLEMFAKQKSSKGGMDIGSMTPENQSRLLDIMEKNEENAFQFHLKKMESNEKIRIKEIDSSTVTQRTYRYIVVMIIIVAAIITLLILFQTPAYFTTWLGFITGLAGGFGLGKIDLKPKNTADE